MGNTLSFSNHVYSIPVSEPTDSESSAVYRAASHPDELISGLAGQDITNVWQLFSQSVAQYPNRPYLGRRFKQSDGELGKYEWVTYAEANAISLQFGTTLLREDICPIIEYPKEKWAGARKMRLLGIYAKNCVEWFLAEQACNAFGFTAVPIYDTMGIEAMQFILTQTKMRAALVAYECVDTLLLVLQKSSAGVITKSATETGLESVASTEDESVSRSMTSSTVVKYHNPFELRTIILVDPPNPKNIAETPVSATARNFRAFGIKVQRWNEICGRGHPVAQTSPLGSDGINTLCYTSGTTGSPKGVLLTQGNVCSLTCAGMRGPVGPGGPFYVGPTDIHVSYLPLAHVYERMVCNTVAAVGGALGLYSGDMTKLLDDIRVLSPSVFISVPRLFNRINDKVLANLVEKRGPTQMLFNNGLNSKLNRHRSDASTSHKVWDTVVFNKIKRMMGDRLRGMICGGAALDPLIQEKMNCFFCAPLMQGYGLTETFGPCFISHPADPVPGHIGGPFPSCEWKLVSVPEMGYLVTNDPPGGELCVRGPSVAVGYFDNEAEQAASYDSDNWFHTGDVAVIVGTNKALKIVDRKKNIFKLSQGEYIAPEKIEGVYQQCLFVAQCFVYGESDKPTLVAIVVPDEEFALKWAAKNGMTAKTLADLIGNPEFKKVVLADMDETAKKMELKGFEKVKAISFFGEEFSVDNGLLTPTIKIKRHEAKLRFRDDIDRMYGSLKTSD